MQPNTPDTVVVAVADKDAEAALAYVRAEVGRRGGQVRVAHVVPMVEVLGLPGPMEIDGDMVRRAGAAVVDPIVDALEHDLARAPGTTVVPTVLHGPTVPELVRVARGARRIVLQRRPRGRRRVVTLSTSNGVAAQAAAQVVVVPSEWQPDPAQEDVVVVGLDDVLTAPHLLQVAFAEAAARQGRLRIVHGWYYDSGYDDLVLAGESGRLRGEELRHDLERELAPTLRQHADVPVQLLVSHTRPAELLTGESESAGILVLGRHRSRLSWGPHLGSVVRAVLREAACPVLVVETGAEGPVPAGTG